jgi:6-phosphogluconate dehydrogenase
MSADFGLIGLAVMGENLVLNVESRGFSCAVFNRTTSKMTEFMAGRAAGKKFVGCETVEALCKALAKPRKVMLMVKAGKPVDDNITALLPFLEAGDIIIDGGNSHFPDSNRRMAELGAKGIHFIGAGVSGGEEGALKGPSIMPGGHIEAWPAVKPIFQAICAKVEDGSPCCDWVGPAGAGHFVKMVHNGIEYGDMQLICEAYQLLKTVLGLSAKDLHEVFAEWNKGDLDSFLIEITRDIFAMEDDQGTGKPLVDCILDTAGQKGTGKWTAIAALDHGAPVTLIGEAVFARCLSAIKDERVEAAKTLTGPTPEFTGDKQQFINDVRDAMFASKLISYSQGYMLMRAAAEEFK